MRLLLDEFSKWPVFYLLSWIEYTSKKCSDPTNYIFEAKAYTFKGKKRFCTILVKNCHIFGQNLFFHCHVFSEITTKNNKWLNQRETGMIIVKFKNFGVPVASFMRFRIRLFSVWNRRQFWVSKQGFQKRKYHGLN